MVLKVVQLLARAKLALTITSLIGCLGSWSYRQRRKVRSFEERILNRFGALSFDAAKENNKPHFEIHHFLFDLLWPCGPQRGRVPVLALAHLSKCVSRPGTPEYSRN